MAEKKDDVRTDRRGFLKFAGLSGIAGGAAMVSGKSAEATEVAMEDKGSGYRETDHVKTFYKSARF